MKRQILHETIREEEEQSVVKKHKKNKKKKNVEPVPIPTGQVATYTPVRIKKESQEEEDWNFVDR